MSGAVARSIDGNRISGGNHFHEAPFVDWIYACTFALIPTFSASARDAWGHHGGNPHIARYGNHRRSSTSRTRASASGSTCASTRMRRRLPRSISISPFRAAGNLRIRLLSLEGSFEISSPASTAAAICTGAKHGPTRSAVRACRRQVTTTLAATPLRPWRQRLLDHPGLVILRWRTGDQTTTERINLLIC
jgi:hypothetical protein